MVERPLTVAALLVLVPAFWLLCPTVVDSTSSFCPRCPTDSGFLQKIQLQVMWLKRPAQDLYKTYLTYMDLQNDLRPFCKLPVAGFPPGNITKKPEGIMLQELYKAVVSLEDALKALENRHTDAEMTLRHQLAIVSLSLTGLLSNIRCAHCSRGLPLVPVRPPERTQDSSSFVQKMEGCQILWNLSKFIRRLAKAFQKQSVKGKRPERQKKKKKKKKKEAKIRHSFSSDSPVVML